MQNPFSAFFSLFKKKGRTIFDAFKDNMGNFEISYPKGWHFDRDIAVVDGKYSVSFQSGKGRFTVSVDPNLPKGFDFAGYAHAEHEGPCSGICASLEKSRFRGKPSFKRDYVYLSGGERYFAGDLIFKSGDIVFSLNWSAPEQDREGMSAIFSKMVDSLSTKKGGS
ncbi:MAG: hypothetical protein V1827_06400 [Candidatus Micrarchaeota archaeon]